MRIAIDNKDYVPKLKDKDIVYVFDNETISELIDMNIYCINKDYIRDIEVDINLTDYDIKAYKKCTINDDLTLPPIKDKKIAIIIPNCNYEEWIEKCLNSILNQTYKNYEVVFVDDMSTDNSINIAYKYVNKLTNIKIIELQQKRLNGGARNEAYLHLSDDVDYIWYVDSDDWLIDENVLHDINQKLKYNPDVLFVGLAQYRNGKTTTSSIPAYKNRYEAIDGWSGSCAAVVKKELATRPECLYSEGTLKEDRTHHRRICIYMNTFDNLKRAVYVWNRTNTKSVTTTREEIIWGTSTIRHYADTLQLYLSVKGKDQRMDSILLKAVNRTKQEIINEGDGQY